MISKLLLSCLCFMIFSSKDFTSRDDIGRYAQTKYGAQYYIFLTNKFSASKWSNGDITEIVESGTLTENNQTYTYKIFRGGNTWPIEIWKK